MIWFSTRSFHFRRVLVNGWFRLTSVQLSHHRFPSLRQLRRTLRLRPQNAGIRPPFHSTGLRALETSRYTEDMQGRSGTFVSSSCLFSNMHFLGIWRKSEHENRISHRAASGYNTVSSRAKIYSILYNLVVEKVEYLTASSATSSSSTSAPVSATTSSNSYDHSESLYSLSHD